MLAVLELAPRHLLDGLVALVVRYEMLLVQLLEQGYRTRHALQLVDAAAVLAEDVLEKAHE